MGIVNTWMQSEKTPNVDVDIVLMDKTKFTVSINENDTVKILKERVREKTGVDGYDQKLYVIAL
jgi:Ubiquitin family